MLNNEFARNAFIMSFALSLGVVASLFIAQHWYAVGWHYGYESGRRTHVKERTVKEGNILKYPFRNPRRETAPASDSDRVQQSGIDTEETTPKESA